MTPDQMRASSQRKFNQVTDLMRLLQVSFMPREKITPDGFIEKVVVFTDDEKYPSAPVEERKPEGDQPAQEEGANETPVPEPVNEKPVENV